MAYQSGNLTSHGNFLDVLKAFLTSSAVVWECLADTDLDTIADSADIGTVANVTLARVIYFRAPGLDFTKEIYVCFWEYYNSVDGYYNIGTRCHTSYSSLYKKEDQAGVSPPNYICMTNAASTPYWFIANGQRVMCLVSSASGVYRDSLYAGWMTPAISAVDEYPLPYVVGGCSHTAATRYDSTSSHRRAFFNPFTTGTGVATSTHLSTNTVSTLWVRTVGGSWLRFGNAGDKTSHNAPTSITDPYYSVNMSGGWTADKVYNSSPAQKVVRAIRLFSKETGFKGLYGELDGVYHVTGDNLNPEDTITIDGVTYLVWNSTNEAVRSHFAAFKLA